MPSSEAPGTPAASRRHGKEAAAGRSFLREINYPHNIHPVLVPGISVDGQLNRYGVDRIVTVVSGALILAFIVWGLLDTQSLTEISTAALQWTSVNMGWAFNSLAVGLLIYLVCLALSRYGRIPLGLDTDKPE